MNIKPPSPMCIDPIFEVMEKIARDWGYLEEHDRFERGHLYKLVEPCVWTYYNDGFFTYGTGCGEQWSFLEGTAEENRATYCPYCGGKIEVREVDGD